MIFSDGLDVDAIETLHRRFAGRVKVSFGWGTLLTNDFRGLAPDDALAPFSLVCKAYRRTESRRSSFRTTRTRRWDQKQKIERYKRVFGVKEQAALEVVV